MAFVSGFEGPMWHSYHQWPPRMHCGEYTGDVTWLVVWCQEREAAQSLALSPHSCVSLGKLFDSLSLSFLTCKWG